MTGVRVFRRAAIIVGVLGVQTWAIVPFASTAKEQAWPFVPYPMYDAAHAYGDAAVAPSLAGVPCTGGPAVVVGPDGIGASTNKHYWNLLNQAVAEVGGDSARRRIAWGAAVIAPGRWCAFEIRHDSASVAPSGLVLHTVEPRVVARWSVR